MTRIDVRCVFDARTEGYARHMWAAAQRLANHPDMLAFHQHAPPPDRTSSWAHGEGLRGAMACCDGNDAINLVADSDTVVLKRGWDDDVRRVLVNFHCFGTTFMPVGGFGAGNEPTQMYKGKPTFTWVALRPGTRWSGCDPQREHTTLKVDTQALAELYGIPRGWELLRDVGWRLPGFLNDNGLTGFGMGRCRKALTGLSDYHEEFELMGQPFVAHQRGSCRIPYMTDPRSREFYEACDRWVKAPT